MKKNLVVTWIGSSTGGFHKRASVKKKLRGEFIAELLRKESKNTEALSYDHYWFHIGINRPS